MTYLIHHPDKAIRAIPALTGTDDAPLGSIATNEDGEMWALLASGWVDVTATGPADGSTVTVVSGDGSVSLDIVIAGGVATIPAGYTLTATP